MFFDCDCQITKTKLLDIATFAETAGFYGVGTGSDMGGGNRAPLKKLKITPTKTWFFNPANGENIYVFV